MSVAMASACASMEATMRSHHALRSDRGAERAAFAATRA